VYPALLEKNTALGGVEALSKNHFVLYRWALLKDEAGGKKPAAQPATYKRWSVLLLESQWWVGGGKRPPPYERR
jgi:hypothetical protein